MSDAADQSSRTANDITVQQFLQATPPGVATVLRGAVAKHHPRQGMAYEYVAAPAIQLYCGDVDCGDVMNFDPTHQAIASFHSSDTISLDFAVYVCRHCKRTKKTFALLLELLKDHTLQMVKVGEYPAFGRDLPAKLLRLFGDDAHLLKSGQQCEEQGLGIGALAYYRRAIENHKRALFDALIVAARELKSAPAELIAQLEHAKDQREFSASVESIKAAFPEQLLLNGENPLKLLHGALSSDLHAGSDDECLRCAIAVREVLSAVADELARLSADKSSLNRSIAALAARASNKRN